MDPNCSLLLLLFPFSGHSGLKLRVGLADLRGLFPPKPFCGSLTRSVVSGCSCRGAWSGSAFPGLRLPSPIPALCARSHSQELYFVRRRFVFPPAEEAQLSTPPSSPCQVLTHCLQHMEHVGWEAALKDALRANPRVQRSSKAAGRAVRKEGLSLPRPHLLEDRGRKVPA